MTFAQPTLKFNFFVLSSMESNESLSLQSKDDQMLEDAARATKPGPWTKHGGAPHHQVEPRTTR